ncbi:MAG: hypothetical protein KDD82_17095 [Planctomycetes bacterium]|nr:hypothetical protein [Planctomycetota bacterium]
MALDYCEVCGVMLDGSTPSHPIQDAVICEQCFLSRRTQVVSEEGPVAPEPLQFHCCYCQSLLRLKPVTKRTRVRCPTCNDTFYLHADGRVEAKLEGSRTAVLQQETLPLQPPSSPDASKTQPIKRPDFGAPSSVEQAALLSDLQPKRLEFLDDLPSSAQPVVDTGAFANVGSGSGSGSSLDLLPEDVGPGDADDFQRDAPTLLREGEVDLEPDALRERAERSERGGKPKRRRPPQQKLSPQERKERQRARAKEQLEREQKLEAAEARGAIKQAEAERRVLAGVAWFLLWLLPLGLSLGCAALAASGQGFASRGAVGDLLLRSGEAANTGVASLRDMLFPE